MLYNNYVLDNKSKTIKEIKKFVQEIKLSCNYDHHRDN